uniref:Uncharacterized protein n=1 Tax=Labrus bergylta TaxID=56723 RepID=A0A3Q3F9B3_9LABR
MIEAIFISLLKVDYLPPIFFPISHSKVHFPLSIIIPSQGSLFRASSSSPSIRGLLKAFFSLKDTGNITYITCEIFPLIVIYLLWNY